MLALSLLVLVTGAVAASRLPLKGDFSALLPPSTESVRHLEQIQARVRAFGTAFVLVEASDPAVRKRAADELRAGIEKLDRSLVARVNADDGPLRRFVWRNRYLFVDLEDLEEAYAALDERIKRGKLDANPLYIDLEDEEEEPARSGDAASAEAPADERLDELLQRLDEAEAKARTPKPFVSKNGRLQLLIVQASFPAAQVSRTRVLNGELDRLIADIERRYPSVDVGL
ncbi:MAG TPA: hypothetical protein VNO33_01415, partial [Kofleriaceae bacterium]|nr:hypothetical protein [Kofleriaceae bacterium]